MVLGSSARWPVALGRDGSPVNIIHDWTKPLSPEGEKPRRWWATRTCGWRNSVGRQDIPDLWISA